MQTRLQAEARLEHEAAMWETQMEADRWDAEINELKAKMGMLEQLSKIVNENTSQSWKDPFGGRGLIGIAINWSCTALQERHCLKQQPRSLRTGFVVSSRMFETLPCLSPTRPEALKLMPSEKAAFSYPHLRVF